MRSAVIRSAFESLPEILQMQHIIFHAETSVALCHVAPNQHKASNEAMFRGGNFDDCTAQPIVSDVRWLKFCFSTVSTS